MILLFSTVALECRLFRHLARLDSEYGLTVHVAKELRLLDNEENLFDAGLYVGLAGTVLSLVLLALARDIIEVSLMVAYVSTLFGIAFVSVLKIFHVRPYRRSLLLESSTQMP